MSNLKTTTITAMATDPIYIGTGGFTIGRVDNTIVRDPITRVPKIPGSSVAGTWRYYVALELQSAFKDEYKQNLQKRAEKRDKVEELFNSPKDWMKSFSDNRFARIKCAGQDDESQKTLDESQNTDAGHCGHCIVCKAFGFSKKDKSNQGMLFFSDLNILFFPVYTRVGIRWVTSPKLLDKDITVEENKVLTSKGNEKHLNLGWLNLEVGDSHSLSENDLKGSKLKLDEVVIVSDSLISQIINSNLEVRTSVSIDPLTGTAKEGALFTSEAIPRGTIFCGEVRGFRREGDSGLPKLEDVFKALNETKSYFNTLGIGGMTTRGFGRLDIMGELS